MGGKGSDECAKIVTLYHCPASVLIGNSKVFVHRQPAGASSMSMPRQRREAEKGNKNG
jgi:hypothetical protein